MAVLGDDQSILQIIGVVFRAVVGRFKAEMKNGDVVRLDGGVNIYGYLS